MSTGKHHRSRRFHYGDLMLAVAFGFACGLAVAYLIVTGTR